MRDGQQSKAVTIASFYRFADNPKYADWRLPLLHCCEQQGLKGTVLLAEEGINGSLSGTESGVLAALAFMRAIPGFSELQVTVSYADRQPFRRMKVRLKKEIVSMGVAAADPRCEVGEYVEPEDWNALITRPEVWVVDARNTYEVAVGTFRDAVNPHTQSFRQLPKYLDEQLEQRPIEAIAMFCTGGIRCEKSTAYALLKGVKKVYHLKGGILNYLEKIPPEDSLWQGECFVFDQRVTVDHQCAEGHYVQCYACRHPLNAAEQRSVDYQPGVMCSYCKDQVSPARRAAFAERHRQWSNPS